MTEKEFTEISLTLGLTFGISYMLFIVYKLAEESKAGRYGMMILFVGWASVSLVLPLNMSSSFTFLTSWLKKAH